MLQIGCIHKRMCVWELYSQHGDAPVFACSLSSRLEAREPNESDSRGNGERADVLQQDTRQTQGPYDHLY